jgi:2-desacetyl-2-hydroxyethyl bacteriochlorophyllide A dehydrogenase
MEIIMESKRIVFTKKDTAELLSYELPEVGSNQVAVKLAVSSISCGTERALVSGNANIGILQPEGTPVTFPRISGYSSAGTVIAVGENVRDIAVGDKVALSWSVHSNVNIINRDKVCKISEGVSFEAAALCHIATFPLAAIRKTGLEIGESMMIMGLGVLGLMAVQLARVAGACPVIAVDPVAERREKALELGADYALDPTDADFVKTVKSITGGGVNTVVEVTGLGIGMDQSLDCMARFGRIALLGCTRNKEFHIDYYRKVHGPGITIVGAHTDARPRRDSSSGWFTEADDMKSLMKLLSRGRLNFDRMIDATYKPEDCTEIYERLVNDRNFPPVSQFDWSNY